MSQRKAVQTMSSAELFALAEQKEQEEMEEEKAAVQGKIDKLRTERKEIIAKHKKALAAVDSKIRKLGGRTASKRKRSAANTTATVLAIVEKARKITTKEIKAELDKQGVAAKNLSQTLAYLKRQGKLKSPARSVYSVK